MVPRLLLPQRDLQLRRQRARGAYAQHGNGAARLAGVSAGAGRVALQEALRGQLGRVKGWRLSGWRTRTRPGERQRV